MSRPKALGGPPIVPEKTSADPLGFSLEQFDAVGRFRTTEHDQAIDPVSDYISDDGEKIHLRAVSFRNETVRRYEASAPRADAAKLGARVATELK